jgi:histidinol dehydrogenase
VKARGDAAVLEYTNRSTAAERRRHQHGGAGRIAGRTASRTGRDSEAQRKALEVAAQRARLPRAPEAGTERLHLHRSRWHGAGPAVTPLDRVGIYVPGGKAAYPSSVLMNAIPAHVAGVEEIIMVVPTPDGVKNQMVLAAAAIAGVTA